MERNVYLDLTSPENARQLWFSAILDLGTALGTEKVSLNEALGRTVSQPVAARHSSPAFNGAAMDGIAVQAEKTFSASQKHPLTLELGKDAFHVNTGRPMPDGTNAVVMIEHVNLDETGRFATLEQAAFPWQHVRKIGEDMVATEIILAPGTIIGPYELGSLAACGVYELPVFKKPRVTIIPTGSEIAPAEEISTAELESGGKLPEFNSRIFAAMLAGAGADPHTAPITPDDPEKIGAALKDAVNNGADLVILNAGSSAGSRDFTAQVIASLGELLVHGIAMMPGKPTSLGLVNKVPVLGAPGYPVSATIAIEEFALPLMAFLQKQAPPAREEILARTCVPLPSRPGMEERVRIKLGLVNGNYFAVPLARGAGVVSSLTRADAVISIQAASEGIGKNEPVKASLLRPRAQIEGALLAIGSHDNLLDLVDSMLRRTRPGFRLTSAHVGSLGGLLALAQGQCHLAGSHLLDPDSGAYNRLAIRQNLQGMPVTLVRLVEREQGLMVRPGNPLSIQGLADLTRQDVSFINRQRGSGTRVLLDSKLKGLGIAPGTIRGYGEEEYTHMNVASAVLSGRADTGLGTHAAASALGLDFIPVGVEEYDLVIPDHYIQDERVQALLEVIRSEAFRERAKAMGGYKPDQSGVIVWRSASETV